MPYPQSCQSFSLSDQDSEQANAPRIAGLTHFRRRHADTDADVPGMAKTFRINSSGLLLLVPTARL